MRFRYTARDNKGTLQKGTIDADKSRTAAAVLKERQLLAVSIEPVQRWLDLGAGLAKFRRVSTTEVANFTRQLSTMITAGLPLTDGLNLLKLQSSVTFSPVVGSILDNVQGGESLSDALAKHPQVFSQVYIALVKAGESAGVLETILGRLADNLEKSREFSSKVKGAMIYPVIVLVGMLAVMILMVVVVIPKLTTLYSEFGVKLPLATQIIVGISDVTIKFGWFILPLLILLGFGVKRYLNQSAGRKVWDKVSYQIPVVGPLLQQIMLTELTQTLALLVGAGVSIVEALKIVAGALGNVVVEEQIQNVAKKVEKGFPVSISFSESETFPPILGQMIAVGEETGKLDDVLAKLSKYYETESEQKVKALTTAIEPLIIILLGVGVSFLVVSIIMPIYNLTNQF